MVLTNSTKWAYGKDIDVGVKSAIHICPTCLKKYIKTPRSPNKCLFCSGLPIYPVQDYEYIEYKPKLGFTEIRLRMNKAVKNWRLRHKDKVNEYKRRHKLKHPEVVKEWNARYRERNLLRLRENERKYYYFKKECIMKAVNNHVVVKRIVKEKQELKTASGILLSTPEPTKDLQWAEIRFVCDNPTVPLKKGDIIGYQYGIPFSHEKEDYDIIDIKEILIIK